MENNQIKSNTDTITSTTQLKKSEESEKEFISKHINNKEFVFNNFNKFPPTALVHWYVDDELFTEQFILTNINYFTEIIDMIVRRKTNLSDEFFKAICTRLNYSQFKSTRRLREPFRNFKDLDNLFY